MAFERADVFEVSQFGIESTYMTAVAATKRPLGVSIMNKLMTEVNISRARGSRVGNVGILNKEWTEASWDAEVATYTDPAYAFAAAFGAPDITTPGGGTLSRDWITIPPAFAAIQPKSLTLESANFVRAGKSAGHTVKTIGFDFTREGVTWSAESFGGVYTDAITPTPGTNEVQTITKSGTVTSGTYTITFYGETTSPLAYDAVAATILAALEALPNIGSGGVSVGGGPVSTTPATITFLKQWAGINIPLVSVGSGSLVGGGTYVPTETTPGVPLTELALKPVSGSHWNLYLDSTAANWGTTKLTRALEVSWSISDLWGMLWVGNTANPSFVNAVPLPPTTEWRAQLEADAAGMAYLTQLRAGTMIFPRIEAIGELIEGALYHRWLHDFAVLLTGVDFPSESQGVTVIDLTGEIVYDPTSKKFAQFVQRSTMTAL